MRPPNCETIRKKGFKKADFWRMRCAGLLVVDALKRRETSATARKGVSGKAAWMPDALKRWCVSWKPACLLEYTLHNRCSRPTNRRGYWKNVSDKKLPILLIDSMPLCCRYVRSHRCITPFTALSNLLILRGVL
jgi:hypothetical protein